jgi:hypothetical protein
VLERKNAEGHQGPGERNNGQLAGATTRRGFLSSSAKLLGGGALAMALGGGTALAQEESTETEATARRRRRGGGDVRILNYALVLERLEYEFYVQVLNRFSERQFENADVFDGLGEYLRNNAHENFVRIRNHEKTHVDTLVSVIKSLVCKYSTSRGMRPLPSAAILIPST